MRPVAAALRTSVLAGLAGLLCWAVVPVAIGWSSTLVTSGSMLPGIRPGDLVVVSPVAAADLRPGMVLLVDNPAQPGNLLLHRLVAVNPDGTYVTKGDANAQRDTTPVPPDNVRGIGRLRVPYLGLPVLWARAGELVPLGITLAVVALTAWWRPRSSRRPLALRRPRKR